MRSGWLYRHQQGRSTAGARKGDADLPDLALTCDDIRVSGAHAIDVWRFTGHDAGTGNPLRIHGWEEWELTRDLKVAAAKGWLDAEDYAQQVAGKGYSARRPLKIHAALPLHRALQRMTVMQMQKF